MAIVGTINTYENEVVHLRGMREDEPLHMPTADEYFAATGRVLLARPGENEPFSLQDGDPPRVLKTFLWSGLDSDGYMNIPLGEYFDTSFITGACPWTSYRIRGIYRSGYTQYFYNTPPASPSLLYSLLIPSTGGFINRGDGWSLDSKFDPIYGTNSLFKYSWFGDGKTYFRYGAPGYSPDYWFPIGFQLELGYDGGDAFTRTGTRFWPAFQAPIKTDYPQYRGWNANWACYNGFANAPNVLAMGAGWCPNSTSGYSLPAEPADE